MEDVKIQPTKSDKPKGFSRIMLDTLCDETGQGSSKRASMFWVLIIIITPGAWVYFYTFHICAMRAAGYKLTTDLAKDINTFVNDNKIVQSVVDQFDPVIWSFLFFFCLISGLASLPWIYKFICAFKGKFDVKDDPQDTSGSNNTSIT